MKKVITAIGTAFGRNYKLSVVFDNAQSVALFKQDRAINHDLFALKSYARNLPGFISMEVHE